MTRRRALVNFCGCFYGVSIFISIFWILLVWQGWKRSDEGIIDYQYVAGGFPSAKQDVASRSVDLPVYARINSRALATIPMCLSPASSSDSPPQWYMNRIVRPNPQWCYTFTNSLDVLGFSRLIALFVLEICRIRLGCIRRIASQVQTTDGTSSNASSVPSNSGWLRADLVKDTSCYEKWWAVQDRISQGFILLHRFLQLEQLIGGPYQRQHSRMLWLCVDTASRGRNLLAGPRYFTYGILHVLFRNVLWALWRIVLLRGFLSTLDRMDDNWYP